MRRAGARASWLAAALVAVAVATPAAAAVTLRASLSRTQLEVGESARLDLTVDGAGAGVGTPEFDVPAGLEVAPAGRQQSFSWVNGRSEQSTRILYEVVALTPGRYTLGPIVVRVGRDTYSSGVVSIEVGASSSRASPIPLAGRSAELRVSVSPPSPYVGQPMTMRVRLLLRSALAEDPEYTPPETEGFWSGAPSPPESYYSGGSERALVTETRTRLYALTPGVSRIGSASATLTFSAPHPADPFGGAGVPPPARMLRVQSPAIAVEVRPLPPGAPGDYGGAVGVLRPRFSVDRTRTSVDVPVTVRLDVRGRGNLSMIGTPALVSDGEIYASTIEDSLPAPGTDYDGRRRFQWTVLPRREGTLTIQPPPFAWFDPEAEAWRQAELTVQTVEVGPPLAASAAAAEESFPVALSARRARPGARPPQAWAWTVAGLCAGAALAARRMRARRPAGPDPLAELIAAVEREQGATFWAAADRAVETLGARGRAVGTLQQVVREARYGGAHAEPGSTRAHLAGELRAVSRPAGDRGVWLVAVLALAAAGALWAGWPRGADATAVRTASAADAAARDGDHRRARSGWNLAWRAGADAPLAARLAWAALRDEDLASASAWVMRGRAIDGRDEALSWSASRVREAGGLLGAGGGGPPVTRWEWAIAGLVLGVLAGALWPRRGMAAVAAGLALLAGSAVPLEQAWRRATPRAVTRLAYELPGGVTLEPGQIVRVIGEQPGRLRVRAGDAAEGWAPAAAFERVADR